MAYTIKMQNKSLKISNIISMVNDNCYFVDIQQDKEKDYSFNVDKELDKRYKSFLKNPKGKDWSDLKNELNKSFFSQTDI